MSGEVPEDWSKGGLGHFLRAAQGGGTPPRENPAFWNGDIPWASVKDMTSRALRPQEAITPEGLKNSTSRVVAAGTNILALRMAVGSVARYAIDVAINQDLVALVPDERLDPDFLFHWLSAHTDQLKSVATGTTVKGLRKDVLLGWPILLPTLEEQRRIAEVLRSVDYVISLAEAEAEALARLRVTLIEGWLSVWQSRCEMRKLKDVIAVMDSGWSPECEGRPADPGEWAVLKTSAVTWNGYDDGENKRLPPSLNPREHAEVAEGDVLITRAGQAYRTGVVAFVGHTIGKRMISDKLVRLKADTTIILPRLLGAMMAGHSVQSQLNPLKSGLTTLTNITQKMIGAVELPIPDMDVQISSVLALENLDTQIDNGRRVVSRLGELKVALVADLLSGRVRVPA